MKIMKKKGLLLGIIAAATFALGYGAVALAYPSPAPYGLAAYHGYFLNQSDTSGTYVLDDIYYNSATGGNDAIPPSLNSASEFISFINTKLGGSAWDKIGASFIVDTMLSGSRNHPPQAAQMTAWTNLVNSYASAGRVNWNASFCFTLNTFYQHGRSGPGPVDDAFFDDSGCDPAIIFTKPDGTYYAIRRQCANPINRGNATTPLPTLTPPTTFTMSSTTSLTDGTPPPGSTITFKYFVQNTGPNSTSPTAVTWHAVNSTTSAVIASGSAGVMAKGGSVEKYSEDVNIPPGTPAGTQYCRRTDVIPATSAGGTHVGPTVCATVSSDFTLVPGVAAVVKDSAGNVITGPAQAGDTITFTYTVNNSGLSDSSSVACTIYGLSKVGSYSVPTPNDQTSDPGYVPPATGCPRVFQHNKVTSVASETLPAAAVTIGKTICRTLLVNPSSSSAGAKTAEVCVSVGIQPYFTVQGGDVTAGAGFGGSCTEDNADIQSWNTNTAPGYFGAGSQMGAWATGDITNFVSGMGLTGGAGSSNGYGLSFANTANTGGNAYGGSYGANAVPCMRDYYGNKPASTTPLQPPLESSAGTLTSFASLATKSYTAQTASGVFTLGSGSDMTLDNGRQVSIYVKGDVLIKSNIKYSYGAIRDIPRLNLYVQGNIYIDPAVSELHGVYVAQAVGGVGGNVETCAPGVVSAPRSYAACNKQLKLVGALMAEGTVSMNRTFGNIVVAPGITNQPAEIYQYTPELWLAAPATNSFTYQSYTSLPPVL